MVFFCISQQCVFLAGQAPVSGHIYLTTLATAFENGSRKRLATVSDTFSRSEGVCLWELPLYSVLHCHCQESQTFLGVYNRLGKPKNKLLMCQAVTPNVFFFFPSHTAFLFFSQYLDWFGNPRTSQRTEISYERQEYLGRQALCWA